MSEQVKVTGHCMLCRAKSIELYGIVKNDELSHTKACQEAGCKHPPYYVFDKKN